ncbi:NAD-dependent epimerase/dehydratase family protein [Synechococcus sp. CBW1107]|uniref:NAD-dependent epimerase/dehydratase family protein n=1 Tax=Synechococcus sp. CBW1107 TaxID=2789857 RepID=UPI002AD494EF|nr:NAD-dependent epimerase/dehydratase family protein [Synechococcus sp. CBW1107]CAK6687518.1 dTDP-L-rhamnose 4-epimerase [Synechococcus sp. CBW1107]
MSPFILITGGAGFIGRNIAELLVSNGISVRILDNLTPQIHGEIPSCVSWLDHDLIDFVRGSINDRNALEHSLRDITGIIHLAAETGTGQSMYEISKYYLTNSQGTALILDVLASSRVHKVSKFILASSRSVYGEGAYSSPISNNRVYPPSRSPNQLAVQRWNPICEISGLDLIPIPTTETDPTRPASVYAASKLAQEDLTKVVCKSLDIDHVIFRFQNVYGEGQSLKNPYTGILSIFSTRIRRGIDLPIFEDGLESRDFVHVDDVAYSVVAAISSSQIISDTINVGSGVGTTVFGVAQELMLALEQEVPVRVTGEYRIGDIRHNIADISRLKSLLSGRPLISLSDGLHRFAAWVKTQPLPPDLLDSANDQLRKRNLMA